MGKRRIIILIFNIAALVCKQDNFSPFIGQFSDCRHACLDPVYALQRIRRFIYRLVDVHAAENGFAFDCIVIQCFYPKLHN